MKSWAVPKGPSLNPLDQRLAIFVEDHPLDYGSFEGIIPRGNYGAGTVMLWDEGTFVERSSEGREDSEKALRKGLEDGHITVVLDGKKLKGEFALVKLKKDDEKAWLLLKKRDEHAAYRDILEEDLSVKTGRNIQEIAAKAPAKGEVWLPKRPAATKASFVPQPSIPPKQTPSAQPENMPRRMKPMLATVARASFEKQDGWVFEPELHGVRAIAEVESGRAHLYSRQLLSFDAKYPAIIQALRALRVNLLLDGEVVVTQEEPVYHVFDLLHEEGLNLRELPLLERKARLQALSIWGPNIQFVPHQDHAEGDCVAKAAYSAYQSGTTDQWLKFEEQTERGLTLTHLDKLYWPREGITKGQLIEYYRAVAPFILPHLKDRPESLNRHPDGIDAPGFFQKDLTGYVPRFVKTERIYSESVDKSIDYLVCNNEATLLYMANLGCIEINPWLSRVGRLDKPDYCVIDLDPDDSNSFNEVIEVAQAVHSVLDSRGLPNFCKTSGATGLHICIPLGGSHTFDESRALAESVCSEVHMQFQSNTSLERSPGKRKGKIYLDAFQNRTGQTLAAPYCVRPKPGAPVSTPLMWEEVVPGLLPSAFTIHTLPDRLKQVGDLWAPFAPGSEVRRVGIGDGFR